MAAKFAFSNSIVHKASSLVEKMFQQNFGRCASKSNIVVMDDYRLLDLMLEAHLRAVLACVSEPDKYFELKETIENMYQ